MEMSIRFMLRPFCRTGKSLIYCLQGRMVPKAGMIMFEAKINTRILL